MLVSIRRILFLSSSLFLALSCANQAKTNAELFHQAYLNVIEAEENEIRPLVNLTLDETRVDWDQEKERVLLFTFHRFPSSYPDGETITFTWGESWLCSLKEYGNWAKENKNNIQDPLLRTKQVLGMEESSANTYISSMWIKVADLKRPAYVTDVTKPMKLSFEENESEEYIQWFKNQCFYSYETKRIPWTRLGYTYDWSKEAKDRYGLSEFIAFEGTEAIVDKTMTVDDYYHSLVG